MLKEQEWLCIRKEDAIIKISIYPYDKGAGMVCIRKEDAIIKISIYPYDKGAGMVCIRKEDAIIKISIYPYDKGAGMVCIRKEDAIIKIREQIGEIDIINIEPTLKICREICKVLSELNKFTKQEYEKLYSSDPIPPRMYGTIKAHKPEKNYPMRIAVSTIGTPTYGISEYLVSFIQCTLDKDKTCLKNSCSFLSEASQWRISSDEVQVSYDVVNLYPSVPLKEATTVILDLLSCDAELKRRTKLNIKEIKLLIDLCLSKCYFLWNDEIHELRLWANRSFSNGCNG